jgi:hypothetical protein
MKNRAKSIYRGEYITVPNVDEACIWMGNSSAKTRNSEPATNPGLKTRIGVQSDTAAKLPRQAGGVVVDKGVMRQDVYLNRGWVSTAVTARRGDPTSKEV